MSGAAEGELREAILSGRFGETLPGLRVLGKVLGVSPPTVAEAVKALIAEGLIRSDGERRRMKIAAPVEPGASRGAITTKVVWFVTSTAFEHAVSGSTTLMALLQQELGGSEWLVRHRVMSYGHSEKRSAQWDQMADAEAPDAMVVWTGRPAIGEWALSRGLRTIFIGGAKENLELPMLAVKSAALVEAAIHELLERGHQRLCLPMCNRPPTMLKNIRTVVSKGLRGVGGSAKETIPVSAYEGGPVIEAMVEQALAERAPTGWIFFDWREFLAASCVFRDRRISIPRDLSAVVLSWDPAMEWYRPAPAHFRQPLERMAKVAVEWVRGEVELDGTRYFPAEWVAGGSLGRA